MLSCAAVPYKSRASNVFQELLGVVADLEWGATTEALALRAACSLPANTPLTPALTAVGVDPDHLIATQGLAALSWAQKGRQQQQAAQSSLQGQGSVQMPWQTPDVASFQLCIEPPEEDECRERKLQLLAASALGTAHALTATSSQVCHSLLWKQLLLVFRCLGHYLLHLLHCWSSCMQEIFLGVCGVLCRYCRLHLARLQLEVSTHLIF